MIRPPIDLGDRAAVRAAVAQIPLSVRPGSVDLMVMVAGADRMSAVIMLVDDVPASLPQHHRAHSLRRMWRGLREAQDDVEVAVTVCRTGKADAGGEDLAWHDAIRATARLAGVTCRGVYLATYQGVVEVCPSAA